MRVLHVFDHSLPLYSGYSLRSRAILDAQHARGWETIQLTGAKQQSGAAREEEVDGLVFQRTPSGALGRVPVVSQWDVVRGLRRRIAELVEAHRPDLVHAHSPALNGLAALPVVRRAGIPLVYEVRAFWEDAAVDHGTTSEGSLRYRLTRALETRVARRADRVVCICEGLRAELVQRGIATDHVHVVGNAVNVDSFSFAPPRDLELAAELGLGDGPVLGFIGSFYAYEGLPLLLDALPAIAGELPEVKVLLVGGGPQDEALRARAKHPELAERVIFTGRVPHQDVPRYASLVDAFVFARQRMRLTELTTPLKPLEAMAQGVLVVASDVGGHKELIRDGETGFLFAAGDADALAHAVVAALGNPARAQNVRDAGRRYVETERTWPVTTERYERIYAEALGARSP